MLQIKQGSSAFSQSEVASWIMAKPPGVVGQYAHWPSAPDINKDKSA
jgi:hypothetical protein